MTNKTKTVKELADMVGGKVFGDEQKKISCFASLSQADGTQITFLADSRKKHLLAESNAGVFLVAQDFDTETTRTLIKVRDPYLSAAIVQNYFLAKPFIATGVHARAVVDDDVVLPSEISIAPLAVIGSKVQLGERVTIGAGAVLGEGVCIGDDTKIMANVTILKGCQIGRRVTIHPGTVIGSDGYGYATTERGEHVKRAQLGIVKIDDDVEIGANCCVDRATFGETWIQSGTKIDNLVQVAHNVKVGPNCLIVSQAGISGSTVLGRNVVMGGQSATSGHLNVGDGVMLAARGAIHNDQPAGQILGGAPAIPAKQWRKCCAIYNSLPELRSKVRVNTKDIKKLQDTDKGS